MVEALCGAARRDEMAQTGLISKFSYLFAAWCGVARCFVAVLLAMTISARKVWRRTRD
jgi:hypothetical protein